MEHLWGWIVAQRDGVIAFITGQSLATIWFIEIWQLAGTAFILGVIGGFAGLLGKGLYNRYCKQYIDEGGK